MPDLVICLATLAAQAAHLVFQDTDVPVLFGAVSDPVGAGIANSLGSPTGTNVTGLALSIFREVKIDFVLSLLGPEQPDPVMIGAIHTSYPSDRGDLQALRDKAGPGGKLSFHSREIPYLDMPAGNDHMLAQVGPLVLELEEQVDFWWMLTSPLSELNEFMGIVSRNSNKPVLLGNNMDHVRSGALISVTGDYVAWGREMAEMAHQLLQGADPGAIPVKPFSEYTVGVNLTTALSLGIVIPPEILRLAQGNVYR